MEDGIVELVNFYYEGIWWFKIYQFGVNFKLLMISDKFIIKCICIIKNFIGRVSILNMKFRILVESEILYKQFLDLRVFKFC